MSLEFELWWKIPKCYLWYGYIQKQWFFCMVTLKSHIFSGCQMASKFETNNLVWTNNFQLHLRYFWSIFLIGWEHFYVFCMPVKWSYSEYVIPCVCSTVGITSAQGVGMGGYEPETWSCLVVTPAWCWMAAKLIQMSSTSSSTLRLTQYASQFADTLKMKTGILLFKFHGNMFPRVHLTISQHWFRFWCGTLQVTSII